MQFDQRAAGASNVMPTWASGLRADAAPLPGNAKYDEFLKERERKLLTPASERGDAMSRQGDSNSV